MEKGLGIGAMVVAILAIFVPVVTIYVVWGALVLATLAALMGDKTFAIVTILISAMNLVFLSPMTWAAIAGENIGGGNMLFYVTIALFITPIVAMVMNAMHTSTSSTKEGE